MSYEHALADSAPGLTIAFSVHAENVLGMSAELGPFEVKIDTPPTGATVSFREPGRQPRPNATGGCAPLILADVILPAGRELVVEWAPEESADESGDEPSPIYEFCMDGASCVQVGTWCGRACACAACVCVCLRAPAHVRDMRMHVQEAHERMQMCARARR